ncbi:hypothetical protein A0J61_04674 [Choanephora cucurbitarum]|uniref:Uncharacterized protein n=1 Tax=Choanephora cucurbitarum TaxID=101091 RepID=A0A1C7NDU5_9FUNG|nr:hypothetical protein A0J61_04674 [Choanephora cucurbitarum]
MAPEAPSDRSPLFLEVEKRLMDTLRDIVMQEREKENEEEDEKDSNEILSKMNKKCKQDKNEEGLALSNH